MLERINYWLKFLFVYKNWHEILMYRFMGQKLSKILLRNHLNITAGLSKSLAVIVDEIFLLERYISEPVKIMDGDTVVDIGAHVGIFSLFAFTNGAKKIISYEPNPINYINLYKNIKVNNISNIFVRNIAISNIPSKVNFYIDKIDSRGRLGNRQSKQGVKASFKINSIQLNDIFINEGITSIDFLKMDCEGCEDGIIMGTPPKILRLIKKISMEYHKNIVPMRISGIIAKLHLAGFKTRILQTGNHIGYIYSWKT